MLFIFLMADGDKYLFYISNGSCTMSLLLWQNKPWQGDQDFNMWRGLL